MYSGLHSLEHLPRFVSNYLNFWYQFKITTQQPWTLSIASSFVPNQNQHSVKSQAIRSIPHAEHLSFICPQEDMSSEPFQRTSTLSAQEMSGHVGQCRQDASSNSVLETLSEGHSVDIRGICGHFMDICGHLRTHLNFAACPDKLACPQGFLSFVLSEDMLWTCPGQMKLSRTRADHRSVWTDIGQIQPTNQHNNCSTRLVKAIGKRGWLVFSLEDAHLQFTS
jgi:hypothetical protein